MVTQPSSAFSTNNTIILTFRLGGQLYGLPVTAVSQIIEIVAITHLPQMPKGIQGAINVHGRIVPVIDLRRRFGLECAPYHLHTPMILAEVNDCTLALIVDMVDDVVAVAPTAAGALADIAIPPTCLIEVVQLNEQVVPVLDVQKLLNPEEQNQLARLLPAAPQASDRAAAFTAVAANGSSR